jgi:hypothetical protein
VTTSPGSSAASCSGVSPIPASTVGAAFPVLVWLGTGVGACTGDDCADGEDPHFRG